MDLSDQKVHAETMPDKQTDEVLMPENLSTLTLMLISLFWIAIIFIPIILIRKKALKKDWKRK